MKPPRFPLAAADAQCSSQTDKLLTFMFVTLTMRSIRLSVRRIGAIYSQYGEIRMNGMDEIRDQLDELEELNKALDELRDDERQTDGELFAIKSESQDKKKERREKIREIKKLLDVSDKEQTKMYSKFAVLSA